MERITTFWKKHHVKILIAVIFVALILILRTLNQQKQLREQVYVEVQTRDLVEEVVIAGRVRTQEQADLAFNRSGRINSLTVNEGAVVREGDRLARIAMGQLYADLKSAQAQLDIAKADADAVGEDVEAARLSLENTEREQQTLIDNAYRALLNNDLQAYNDDPADSSAAPTITGTYAGSQEGEYILDLYASGSDSGFSYSLSGLESGGGAAYTGTPDRLGIQGLFVRFDSNSDYRNQTWRVPIPNTRSATYTSALNTYTSTVAAAERAIDAARDQLDRIEAQELSSERNARTDAQIQQAQARVNAVYAQISDGTIRAPFDGIVGAVNFDEGEHATTGQTVLSLIGEERYEITLNVPEIDIAKITLGDQVILTLDAYNDVEWVGEIVSINASETFVDGVPVYETTVMFVDPDERIRSGMNGQARIVTGERTDVLAVPAAAIERTGRDAYQVRVVREDTIETIEVMPGLRGNDSFVEIVEGLTINDVLVLDDESGEK
jgi:RND family efflux transporter MFP subunit